MKSISKMGMNLLTPCLLYYKMLESLDLGQLIKLWIAPLVFIFCVVFGFIYSRGTSLFLGLPKGYTRFIDVLVFSMNCNTLPFALLYSIITSPGVSFLLKSDQDTLESAAARSIAYAVLFGIPSNILRWSVGVKWMRPYDKSHDADPDKENDNNRNSSNHIYGGGSEMEEGRKESDVVEIETPTEKDVSFYQYPKKANDESDLRSYTSGYDYAKEQQRHQHLVVVVKPHIMVRVVHKISDVLKMVIVPTARAYQKYVSPYLSGPMYSIIGAIITMAIPGLRENMTTSGTLLYSVLGALKQMGDASIPLTIMSLGAQLGLMNEEDNSNEPEKKDQADDYRDHVGGATTAGIGAKATTSPAVAHAATSIANSSHSASADHPANVSPTNIGVTRSVYERVPSPRGDTSSTLPSTPAETGETFHRQQQQQQHHSSSGKYFESMCGSGYHSAKPDILQKPSSHSSSSSSSLPDHSVVIANETLSDDTLSVENPKTTPITTPRIINSRLNIFTKFRRNTSRHRNQEFTKTDSHVSANSNKARTKKSKEGEAKFTKSYLEKVGLIVTLTGRYIVSPVFTIALLMFLYYVTPNIAPVLRQDPTLFFTMLVLSGCPTAINLITVSQANGYYQDETAIILFWSYLLGSVIMAAEISGFLWLTQLLFPTPHHVQAGLDSINTV
ncbi:hypothetical protein H4219_002837 [Mycoemilia scoparia]|uniref:Uncharacterized protein n=1 Tax=Mycoemilia scoparia TaxID=417184 RepID=A0A9W8A5V4_9FUNG|nr:hypothetical protein H4219_002837 [Mycoemilia scoparia]